MNKSNFLIYAKPWETFACVFAFLLLFVLMLCVTPSVEDDNVYSVDDVIVSYQCFASKKSAYIDFKGASGRVYSVGARKGFCSNDSRESEFLGKAVTAYFVEGGDGVPIQLDIDGVEGYKGGVTFNRAVMVALISGFLIFFPFFVLLVSRQKRSDLRGARGDIGDHPEIGCSPTRPKSSHRRNA